MAREFLVTYNTNTEMDHQRLKTLNDIIIAASNDNYKIVFLEKKNDIYVYGFKLKDIPEHDWIWDGQMYFNLKDGYVNFNIGTVQQMETFNDYIVSILNFQNISLSIEEE